MKLPPTVHTRTQALFSFLVKTKKESRQIYIDQLLIEQARGGVSTADLYTLSGFFLDWPTAN
jgi:hypothetical protein